MHFFVVAAFINPKACEKTICWQQSLLLFDLVLGFKNACLLSKIKHLRQSTSRDFTDAEHFKVIQMGMCFC